MRIVLGAVAAFVVLPAMASAQVVIVDGSVDVDAPCAPACPACLPGVPCPPCAPPPPGCVSASGEVTVMAPPSSEVVVVAPAPPPPPGTVTLYASGDGGVTAPGGEARPTPPPRAVSPAPGTLGLGYLGGWDGIGVWSGGGLRFTGHVVDIVFVEVTLGVLGRTWDDSRTLIELPLLVGVRLMGPLVTPIARMYATLATGIALRTLTNEREAPVWGAWPAELGGGIEVGGPLDDRFAIGGFVDVRLATRIPFERQDATIGIAWSAGLALLWF